MGIVLNKQIMADENFSINFSLVGCWLVKDLSRFGRDYLTVGQYTDIIFPSFDVRFIAVNDGVDSARGDADGFSAIRNLFNEWYPRDTSKKVRVVFQQKGNSGKHLGKPPYGYRTDPADKDYWILDEDAAPVVKRIHDDKKQVDKAKKRLADLEIITRRIYDDYALGNIDLERYKKMSADYDAEIERLKLEIEVTEEWVEQQQEMNDGLDAFIALTKKYVDVTELTPTIVNEYIKKILVYAPDKSSGKRQQRVKVFFNFVDEVDIPVLSEEIITETTYGRRKTA